MTHKALAAVDQIIAALTYEEIEQHFSDGREMVSGDQVPLLHRSISQDLLQLERAIGARGKTLLSAIAASIDEALLAAEQARQTLGQASASNVKPAPFFLNEKTVRDLLGGRDGPSFTPVPIEPIDLTDQPAEPEPDPIDEPAPEPVPSPDWPDAPIPDEFGTPDELSEQAEAPAEEEDDEEAREAVERAYRGEFSARRFPTTEQRGAARAPRQNEDEPSRVDMIRDAAKKLQEDREADDARPIEVPASSRARKSTRRKPARRASEKRANGVMPRREARATPPLPPLPFEQRRARLQAAEAFLKRFGILVSVIDREAQIRKYRVTGKHDSMLAEQVIEFAESRGMRA